jgi:hypothetical protein
MQIMGNCQRICQQKEFGSAASGQFFNLIKVASMICSLNWCPLAARMAYRLLINTQDSASLRVRLKRNV